MGIPKYYELFYTFLEALRDGQKHKLNEITGYCADKFNLTEEEKNAKYPSGTNIFSNNIVGVARTYLKKAGLITSPEQSSFQITELGLQALQRGPEAMTLEYVRQLMNDYNDNDNCENEDDVTINDAADSTQSPQEAIKYAINELNSALADELLAEISVMNNYDFERLVVDLLIKMGYGTLQQNEDAVTPKSRDEGIDGFVKADRLGFDSIYTQAKKWKNDSKISTPEIQKFLGALAGKGATKGLFITTGQFTQGARDFVKKQLNHKIVLIDGRELANYMIEYNLGVTTVTTYAIKRIDSDYFAIDN